MKLGMSQNGNLLTKPRPVVSLTGVEDACRIFNCGGDLSALHFTDAEKSVARGPADVSGSS